MSGVGLLRISLEPDLEQLISGAFVRFETNLRAALPRTAPRILAILHGSAPLFDREKVLSPKAFPHYILPYLLSPIEKRDDIKFQSDILYSTINGSYSIRLCDNIADNDDSSDLIKFTPCIAYFDKEFLRPYMRYFPVDHELWLYFDKFWSEQCDVSSADSLLDDIDYDTFLALSSKKFTATKIPIAAIRFRYEGLEIQEWLRFVDLLGIFAQFSNDFFDWNHDSIYGIKTYVSSEAKRRAPSESLAKWFLKEGFEWGVSMLQLMFSDIINEAERLSNKAIIDWLIMRRHVLDTDITEARSGLQLVKAFIDIASIVKPKENGYG
jgi:hypothetical protein